MHQKISQMTISKNRNAKNLPRRAYAQNIEIACVFLETNWLTNMKRNFIVSARVFVYVFVAFWIHFSENYCIAVIIAVFSINDYWWGPLNSKTAVGRSVWSFQFFSSYKICYNGHWKWAVAMNRVDSNFVDRLNFDLKPWNSIEFVLVTK